MPTAAVVPQDKYYLRSLHQEISLFDRKIAHLLKHETFETEEARKAAAAKLETKRNNLARTAKELVESGVEFKPSELPASMQTPEQQAQVAVDAAAASEAASEPQPAAESIAAAPSVHRTHRAFDLGQEIRQYMADRKRA